MKKMRKFEISRNNFFLIFIGRKQLFRSKFYGKIDGIRASDPLAIDLK
jgi:hypothetical protein